MYVGNLELQNFGRFLHLQLVLRLTNDVKVSRFPSSISSHSFMVLMTSLFVIVGFVGDSTMDCLIFLRDSFVGQHLCKMNGGTIWFSVINATLVRNEAHLSSKHNDGAGQPFYVHFHIKALYMIPTGVFCHMHA